MAQTDAKPAASHMRAVSASSRGPPVLVTSEIPAFVVKREAYANAPSCFSNQWSANGSSLKAGTSTQPADR